MNTITFNKYLLSFLTIFTMSISSYEIEEVVVKADWREANVIEQDSSTIVLDKKTLPKEPVKHFESLS